MRATCAKRRRTSDDFRSVKVCGYEFFARYDLTDNVGSKFAAVGKIATAVRSVLAEAYTAETCDFYRFFDKLVVFFKHVNLFKSLAEVCDSFGRNGERQSDFKVVGVVFENFLSVVKAHTACDNAYVLAVVFDGVEFC